MRRAVFAVALPRKPRTRNFWFVKLGAFFLALALQQAVIAAMADAQARDTTVRAGTTISGVVYDSVAKRPLTGATVQLVTADSLSTFVRTVISDARGRFSLAAVADGRYILGFIHERLEELGLEPLLHTVHVVSERSVRVDLAIPSPATIRTAICGVLADSSGVVMGVVRDARDGAPASGATVVVEWLELAFSARGVNTQRPSIADTTRANGWFVLCNVPSPGEVSLLAGRAADSTDRLLLSVPEEGFLRRDLYVGSPRADVPSPPLGGTVVTVQGARPIADALVTIAAGTQTRQARTNEHGEWTLSDAPLGTRRLEVRAVGYAPEELAVDVIAAAPPVRVALFTVGAMLDTIKVTASRRSNSTTGFEQRRRASGMGRFITPEDIARRHAIKTSDLLRVLPGISIASRQDQSVGSMMLYMRGGAFSAMCVPLFYLNGLYAGELSADELDGFVNPDQVAGVEIYRAPMVPPQFSMGHGGGGCGSIVVWTRPALGPRNQASWKKRVLGATAVFGGAWAIGTLVFRR